MDTNTKLLLISLFAIAVSFVYVFTRVLAVWCEHHLTRHNLVVASKNKRNAYYLALAEREAAYAADEPDSVEIIDEQEAQPEQQPEPFALANAA